ncbi:hypothetical protein BGY98DRAFT_938079 [Russula aff. rugulosa BPL654]|nr:hypothetical protein BGY98DRAFT_938079 [Russula aff. rugulosa BPL654]
MPKTPDTYFAIPYIVFIAHHRLTVRLKICRLHPNSRLAFILLEFLSGPYTKLANLLGPLYSARVAAYASAQALAASRSVILFPESEVILPRRWRLALEHHFLLDGIDGNVVGDGVLKVDKSRRLRTLKPLKSSAYCRSRDSNYRRRRTWACPPVGGHGSLSGLDYCNSPSELDRTFNKYGIEECVSLSSLVDVAHLADVLRSALKILIEYE